MSLLLIVFMQHVASQQSVSCRVQALEGVMRTRVIASASANRLAAKIRTMPGRANLALPALVAFDLDGTMWWPEMYMLDGGAPFRRDASGAVFDSAGERIKLLGNTLDVINTIASDPAWAGVEIAYVSRTEYPEWAVPCLQQFPIPSLQGKTLYDVSSHNEIYPGSKLRHFKAIHERCGIDYADMLFFDNEQWNCKEVSRLGVHCVYTPRGMTAAAWQQGLAAFAGAAGAGGGAAAGQKQKQKKKKVADY